MFKQRRKNKIKELESFYFDDERINDLKYFITHYNNKILTSLRIDILKPFYQNVTFVCVGCKKMISVPLDVIYELVHGEVSSQFQCKDCDSVFVPVLNSEISPNMKYGNTDRCNNCGRKYQFESPVPIDSNGEFHVRCHCGNDIDFWYNHGADNHRLYKLLWVDKELEDEWIHKLNHLPYKDVVPISICFGHFREKGECGYPHAFITGTIHQLTIMQQRIQHLAKADLDINRASMYGHVLRIYPKSKMTDYETKVMWFTNITSALYKKR